MLILPIGGQTMHVLITRRRALNEKTGQQLSERGHVPVSLPLAKIVDTKNMISQRDFGGILFTSQAAIEILSSRPTDLAWLKKLGCPVYCVGDETAEQAKAAGFRSVSSASGSSTELSKVVQSNHSDLSKTLLYLAGVARSGALDDRLMKAGFQVELVEIYRSDLLSPKPETLKQALIAASKGCGLLYSARSATHLFNLCEKYELSKCLNLRGFIAISSNVAKAVEPLTTQPIFVANSPSQEAILECIDVIQSR